MRERHFRAVLVKKKGNDYNLVKVKESQSQFTSRNLGG